MTYREHEKHSVEVVELLLFDGGIESRRRESRDSEWKRTEGTKSPRSEKIAGEDNRSDTRAKSFNEMTPHDTTHYKLGFLKQRRSFNKSLFKFSIITKMSLLSILRRLCTTVLEIAM